MKSYDEEMRSKFIQDGISEGSKRYLMMVHLRKFCAIAVIAFLLVINNMLSGTMSNSKRSWLFEYFTQVNNTSYLHRNTSIIVDVNSQVPRNNSYNDKIKGNQGDLKIALLVSFPNSGTSYTLQLAKRSTLMLTASNYCNEYEKFKYRNVFSSDMPGPVYSTINIGRYKLPENFILTKTHCKGYCSGCSPEKYFVGGDDFRQGCMTVASCGKERKRLNSTSIDDLLYYESLIGKIIHLFRDPFDNIVARFHLHVRQMLRSNTSTEFVKDFENNAEGFQKYCSYLNSLHSDATQRYFGNTFTLFSDSIPCLADFFRYAQWHNNAFKLTSYLQMSPHIIYYEDYGADFKKTTHNLISELSQFQIESGPEFHRNDYSKYFTNEQKLAIKEFLFYHSSAETLHHLKRYFKST